MMLAFTCLAQSGHLKFMGLPIDGELNTFVNKLIMEKGFKVTPMNEGEGYVPLETIKVKGDYNDFRNVTIFVNRHRQLANVSSVYVEFDATAHNKELLQKEIERLDQELGKNTTETLISNKIYKWETEEGNIEVYDSENTLNIFRILFIDYTQRYIVKKAPVALSKTPLLNTPQLEPLEESFNYDEELDKFIDEAKEKQTVREICSIPFGSSLEKAKSILENKFGYPDSKDVTTIIYNHKSYGGIIFDKMYFLFQSDGISSFFNGCTFIINANSLEEANKHLERLHDALSEKYYMVSDVDENGNKFYVGGYPPTKDETCAFIINIIKYDKKVAKLYSPYSARLMYGPYNYIKEEF